MSTPIGHAVGSLPDRGLRWLRGAFALESLVKGLERHPADDEAAVVTRDSQEWDPA